MTLKKGSLTKTNWYTVVSLKCQLTTSLTRSEQRNKRNFWSFPISLCSPKLLIKRWSFFLLFHFEEIFDTFPHPNPQINFNDTLCGFFLSFSLSFMLASDQNGRNDFLLMERQISEGTYWRKGVKMLSHFETLASTATYTLYIWFLHWVDWLWKTMRAT